jgi:hypothetical protein
MKMRIPTHWRVSHVATRIYLVFLFFSARLPKKQSDRLRGCVGGPTFIMVLAVAHLFGFYNPKQLADFLDIPHQQLYAHLKDWSIYHLKKMLLGFMVKQAAEEIGPVLNKSDATRSRAGMTLSIDNSVIDRLGKFLRCNWS